MNEKIQSILPILYSFRRCPYAIRARMTIYYSRVTVELREIVLRDKPISMLEYSPKGTVPVLVSPSGNVVDESREVMNWALSKNDPDQWKTHDLNNLIEENDSTFKQHLDQYKYADRYPDHSAEYYRNQCEIFLQKLETNLIGNNFLLGEQITEVDVAIFPFIRQFAFVDKDWFDQTPYPQLRKWLDYFLESELFLSVMKKYKIWQPNDEVIVFN